jgi:hypothetical protein
VIWVWSALGVLISGVGVATTVALKLQEQRDRRRSERTEQAGRILELMEAMGTKGMDPHLSEDAARRAHELELHRLRWIIRSGAVDFCRRHTPTELPQVAFVLLPMYSSVLLASGCFLLGSAEAATIAPAKTLATIVGATMFFAGVIGLLSAFFLVTSRAITRISMEKAGLQPPVREITFRKAWAIVKTRWRVRRSKRVLRRPR